MQSVQKLIDYFLVVGLNDKVTQCNYGFNDEEKHITNLELFFGYISKETESNTNENEKWIDLDGYKTVWLKLTFNKDATPITFLDFLTIPIHDNKLNMPVSPQVFPISIKNFTDQPSSSDKPERETQNLLTRDFDLTEILGFERVPGHAIVLCYKLYTKGDYQIPLEDIEIMTGERRRDLIGNVKDVVNVKIGYEMVHRRFVNKDKTFRCLVYKRGESLINKSYVADVIDRYPQDIIPGTQEILMNIQMFCFPDGIKFSREIREPFTFSFILTKESGERVYGTSLIFDEDFPENLVSNFEYGPINKENPLYAQKAICILSHAPFLGEFKDVLKQIYRIHLSKNEVPIERVICNLVDETPLPDRGRLGVLVDYGQPIMFKKSANYPIVPERAIHNLFKIFNSHRIIDLVKMVLLEKKILLISQYKSLLTDISNALTGFVFPFVWVRPLIPILPAAWRDCIDCPMPFMIGLNISTPEEEEGLPIADDVIKVYLDKGELVYTERMPSLPEKAYKTLIKRLEVFDKWHQLNRGTTMNYDSAFEMNFYHSENDHIELNVYEVQDAFFELMSSLLKHYTKFFLSPKENKNGLADLKETFDVVEFLKKKKSNKEGTFLYKVIHETSFFSNFIQARTSFSKQEVDYEFIDKCIKKKRSKKEPRFIQSPEVEKVFKTYAPNTSQITQGNFHMYRSFPKLNSALFINARMMTRVVTDGDSLMKSLNAETQKLSLIDESKWAKFLLETIYTIWFLIFNIRIKNDYKEYFKHISEFAIQLFEDAQNKGVKPNEIIFKSLIEALCYCDMNDKALQIANKLKESKTDLSPFAFGIYLDTSNEARKFRGQNKKQATLQNQEKVSDSLRPNSLLNRFININTNESCPECNESMTAEDIISGWKKSYNEYTTRCQVCGKNFVASFKVVEQLENSKTESPIHFLSPLIVKKEVENLLRIKGPQIFSSESFEKDHKIIFWNLYLYFNLIKAPIFLFENDIPQEHVTSALKTLEEQFQNSQEKKPTWNISFFANPFKAKSQINIKDDISQLGNDKQYASKINESTKVSSNESMRVTMAVADLPECNSHIKKTFSVLFLEYRKESERKIEEFEFGSKLKKEQGSPADSAFIEDIAEYNKSSDSVVAE